jgi:hypothetical protein
LLDRADTSSSSPSDEAEARVECKRVMEREGP